MGPRGFVGVVVALLAFAAFGTEISGPGPAARPFRGSAASLGQVGEWVLEGLTLGDTAALRAIRLSAHEHNTVIWPELPAAAPEANFPVDFAWKNIQLRNARAVARLIPWFEERELHLSRVECRGPTRRFDSFRVHTDCFVIFQWHEETMEAQLFEDVLERNGGFKIFRYYDHRPRLAEPQSSGEARS